MDRIAQEETKAHLMETNEDFRQLAGRHSQLSRQLDELMSRAHLSEQEHVEEVRLKKLKLRLKDQMEAMMKSVQDSARCVRSSAPPVESEARR